MSRNQILLLAAILVMVLFFIAAGLSRRNQAALGDVDVDALRQRFGRLMGTRYIGPEDIKASAIHASCWRDGGFEVAAGQDCAATVASTAFGMRTLLLRAVEGGAVEFEYRPYDDRALTVSGRIPSQEASDEIVVMKGGGRLRLRAPAEPARVELGRESTGFTGAPGSPKSGPAPGKRPPRAIPTPTR